MSLGELPERSVLSSLPGVSGDIETSTEENMPSSTIVRQASSLLALLNSKGEVSGSGNVSRVWLGEGLGSITKKTYDKMIKWEFMDMSEFRIRSPLERIGTESDTQKIIVLPGFEVSQARSKPIRDIFTWMNCFCRYTAGMATKFPDCTPGFMSHMVTVLKSFVEVEDPAWRMYDVAFREKMAATGVKSWAGMDVHLFQEMCGARPRKRGLAQWESGAKADTVVKVCWKFNNEGVCKFGKDCKFPHICEVCGEGHSN